MHLAGNDNTTLRKIVEIEKSIAKSHAIGNWRSKLMCFDVPGLHQYLVEIGKTATQWLRGRKATGTAKRYLEF